jgi:hypothetical protein
MKVEKYNEPLLSYDAYFSTWIKEEVEKISEEHKLAIYSEYKTRHTVFNRDNFKCQVEKCPFDKSPITMHHFKHKSNGGKTSPRNCITVCRAHQNQYHSGRTALKFIELEHLPPHIAGATQAHEWYVNGKSKRESSSADWKLKRFEMRQLRKQNREMWGRNIPMDLIMLLMNYLFGSNPLAFASES